MTNTKNMQKKITIKHCVYFVVLAFTLIMGISYELMNGRTVKTCLNFYTTLNPQT